MLLEFGFKNFFSFKEGVSISFELDNKCPQSISRGKNYCNILGVKGANASGKTHILKAISFLGWFCKESFTSLKPEEDISILPFYESKKPTHLYAKFISNDVTYLYELVTTRKAIKRETIYRTIERKTKILERTNNEITVLQNGLSELKKITLRNNASIISTAHQYGIKELDDIFHFFRSIVSNVTFGGWTDSLLDVKELSRLLLKNKDILEFTKKFISESDTGVSDIQIIESKEEDGSVDYFPIFLHKVDGKEEPVTRYTESSGTRSLYEIVPLYYEALSSGGFLAIDEFDIHLHPHILPKLLNLFEDERSNKKNAQILFTTHNSEILNYLGKYRTYLTNKEDNACFAYRLDEIPGDIIRNDRPILPAYDGGKIGGVPKI